MTLPPNPGQSDPNQPLPGQNAGPGPFPQYPTPHQYPNPQNYQTEPTPPPAKGNALGRKIAIALIAVVIVVAGVAAFSFFRDNESGTTVASSPVGSCLKVTGSTMNVKTEAIDCDDTSVVPYVVGTKLPKRQDCLAGDRYRLAIEEFGGGASDEALCLFPNYQAGTCYSESSFSMSSEIEKVACSTTSNISSTAYKITERTETGSVPNCDGPQHKALSFTVEADPARTVSVCAEMLGDYTWE